jgi:hypothetical protein
MNNDNCFIKSALASLFIFALIMMVSFAIISSTNFVQVVYAGTNVIGANLVIPNTCIPIINNAVINFGGSVGSGTFVPTSNNVNVINFGNAAANIFVGGGNWASANNAFWVSNTLWSRFNAFANNIIGTQMANTFIGADTQIPILQNGAGNTIWFGLNVPGTQATGTYTQTINIMLSC